MDFALSPTQRVWQERARALAREWPDPSNAALVVASAEGAGLLERDADLLSAVVAAEAAGAESPVGAVVLALHTAVVRGMAMVPAEGRVGAVALSSEELPREDDGRLTGRATWVSPLTEGGLLVVGATGASGLVACVAPLDAPGVDIERVATAGLEGLSCGHVRFEGTPCAVLGPPKPIMAHVRVLLAAVGIGMGRRALREALRAAQAYGRTGAGGEQTLQGLLADTATELDAAMLLVRQAALSSPVRLGQASMAKLAATEAAQRAVSRATQVVGAESFRRGHILDRLAQDVRALELFAGRTEALREAVADDELPRT